MDKIAKIICGKMPRTMPDGSQSEADYYELTVTEIGADLLRVQGSQQDVFYLPDDTLLRTALEQAEALTASQPDEQLGTDCILFSSEITFQNGTVKSAPRDALTVILSNLVPPKIPFDLNPQGIVSAKVPFTGMQGLFNLIAQNPQQNQPPKLQGIVPASRLPKPAGQVSAERWICAECGAESGGKFCHNCGSPKPNNA